MRRSYALALAVFTLTLITALAVPVTGHAPGDNRQVGESVTIIEVGDSGDRLWPYTSRSDSFDGRTLVINAIIIEDPETARELLGENVEDSWERTSPTREPLGSQVNLANSQSLTSWQHAHGSVRYTYVETSGADDGRWLEQRYQVHVGAYLGSRHHIRAFAPSEDSSWTALQAHSEYWDWFRLRHTVTDIHGTADMLETEFQGAEVESVERRHERNARGLTRGIVVVVSALFPVLVGITTRKDWSEIDEWLSQSTSRHQALLVFGLAGGIPLTVRALGIGLEGVAPAVTPKLFVALLYPCLAVGLPLAVAWYGADLPAWVAGPVASVGLVLGFAIDFAVLGVIPPDQILGHRLILAAALGLLAAGGIDRRPLLTVAGAAIWLWGLAAPLFGFL